MKGTLEKSDKNEGYFTKNGTRMKGTLQKSDKNEGYFTKIGQA